MNLSAETQAIGLLGHPVAQSLSPQMQNAAIATYGLPYVYLAFDVQPHLLAQAVMGLRGLGFRGANVTVPFKVEIAEFLDGLSEEASLCGAVNTIVNENGRLIGYNTDGEGFLKALESVFDWQPQGQHVLLLGAGGAARAIGAALLQAGVEELFIYNRTPERAIGLASLLGRMGHGRTRAVERPGEAIPYVQLLVNATSVGMDPKTDAIPLNPELLDGKLLVADLVYQPQQTRLLREAQRRGCRTMGGLHLLLHQGALSFERWMHRPAPLEEMERALHSAISNG